MRICFLGSGTMFCPTEKNFTSNLLLESERGKKLLIDCGIDIRQSLPEAHYTPEAIDSVYISHFHSDHVGGLEWLALYRKFYPPNIKPNLIIHPKMKELLWDRVLSGGLMTLGEETASLDSFFTITPVDAQGRFLWEDISFEMVEMLHVCDNYQQMPCYGLCFQKANKTFFFTADTQFTPERLMPYYQKADVIFHECETGSFTSGVHCQFADLCTLPVQIKKKIWLYHYSSSCIPDATSHGFAGVIKKGQVFI